MCQRKNRDTLTDTTDAFYKQPEKMVVEIPFLERNDSFSHLEAA